MHHTEYDRHIPSSEMNRGLKTMYPHVREKDNDIRMPRRWDGGQASSFLEIAPNGLSVTFKRNANIQGEKDPSGVVRADTYIPSSVGSYYFEVKILHVHGQRDCNVGVGLSKLHGELNRMPGWDPHCYGYHGDDGNFFSACGHGKPYGPKFGTGDTIGCGIDTNLNIVWFTKNGHHLRTAYEGNSGELENLYPTVGLRTPGERLHVNFGQAPFLFDFDGYRDTLNNEKIRMLEKVKMPANIGSYMDRMVASYLGYAGAMETLKAFEKVAKVKEPIDHEFVRKRKEISDMILNAEGGAKIQQRLREYFPGCLENKRKVRLFLTCLRYIDLAATIQKIPYAITKTMDEPGAQPQMESSARPPKNSKNSKNGKRAREAQKKQGNQKAQTPMRGSTEARAYEDALLKEKGMEKFSKDKDTGEEVINYCGIYVTREMLVELVPNDEHKKMAYIIQMGRDIMKLATSVQKQMGHRDRCIVEVSLGSLLRAEKTFPLAATERRYIANEVVEVINNYKPEVVDVVTVQEMVMEHANGNAHRIANGKPREPGPRNMFSEIRSLFLAWQGLHFDMASRDYPAAAVYFMRHMALEEAPLPDKPIKYSDEPMETDDENGEASGSHEEENL